jgi:hypothetical protein
LLFDVRSDDDFIVDDNAGSVGVGSDGDGDGNDEDKDKDKDKDEDEEDEDEDNEDGDDDGNDGDFVRDKADGFVKTTCFLLLTTFSLLTTEGKVEEHSSISFFCFSNKDQTSISNLITNERIFSTDERSAFSSSEISQKLRKSLSQSINKR